MWRYVLVQGFSNISVRKSPGSHQNADPVDLGWGIRLCFSNELPGDAAEAGPWATLRVTRL